MRFLRRIEFARIGDHRQQDAHRAERLHGEQAAQLIVEQIRAHLREADAAQAERRVRLGRQRQVIDFLVRADVERADDRGAAA